MKKIVVLAASALACLTGPAQGEDCKLVQAASVPLTFSQPDRVALPLNIAGKDHVFALNTGSVQSWIGVTPIGGLEHTQKTMGSVFINGHDFTLGAVLPKITLGGLSGTDQGFFIAPDENLMSGTDGELGLDKIEGYDAELDIAHGKLNLFSKDHCKGQVIYWTDAAAVIPFELQATGQISVPMELDGQKITVMLDTPLANSRMAYATAHRLFGIYRSDLEAAGASDASHGYDVYHRPFKTLNAGGLAIANPGVDIVDFGDVEAICDGKVHVPQHTRHYPVPYKCYGGADVRLGLKQISQLRMFIAFSEKTLYITPATAH